MKIQKTREPNDWINCLDKHSKKIQQEINLYNTLTLSKRRITPEHLTNLITELQTTINVYNNTGEINCPGSINNVSWKALKYARDNLGLTEFVNISTLSDEKRVITPKERGLDFNIETHRSKGVVSLNSSLHGIIYMIIKYPELGVDMLCLIDNYGDVDYSQEGIYVLAAIPLTTYPRTTHRHMYDLWLKKVLTINSVEETLYQSYIILNEIYRRAQDRNELDEDGYCELWPDDSKFIDYIEKLYTGLTGHRVKRFKNTIRENIYRITKKCKYLGKYNPVQIKQHTKGGKVFIKLIHQYDEEDLPHHLTEFFKRSVSDITNIKSLASKINKANQEGRNEDNLDEKVYIATYSQDRDTDGQITNVFIDGDEHPELIDEFVQAYTSSLVTGEYTIVNGLSRSLEETCKLSFIHTSTVAKSLQKYYIKSKSVKQSTLFNAYKTKVVTSYEAKSLTHNIINRVTEDLHDNIPLAPHASVLLNRYQYIHNKNKDKNQLTRLDYNIRRTMGIGSELYRKKNIAEYISQVKSVSPGKAFVNQPYLNIGDRYKENVINVINQAKYSLRRTQKFKKKWNRITRHMSKYATDIKSLMKLSKTAGRIARVEHESKKKYGENIIILVDKGSKISKHIQRSMHLVMDNLSKINTVKTIQEHIHNNIS